MSAAEEKLRAQLQRADAKIAELEAQLKTASAASQIFAGAIVDAAVRVGMLTPEKKAGLSGVQVLHLLENIVELAEESK